MTDRQEKGYDEIIMTDKEIITGTGRPGEEDGALLKKRWKARILWRAAVLAALLFTLICLLVLNRSGSGGVKTGFEREEEFDGTEPVPARGLADGGLGGTETADYAAFCFAAGRGPEESPVKDNSAVKKLSVYRSLRAKSSDDTYRLLTAWAEDLQARAKEELGLTLTPDPDGVMINGEPYHREEPVTAESYPLYNLWIDLHCEGTTLRLMCWSEGAVTYYSLKGPGGPSRDNKGIGALYEAWSGQTLKLPETYTQKDLDAVSKPLLDFAGRLTGAGFQTEDAWYYETDPGPGVHYYMEEPNGCEMSQELLRQQHRRDAMVTFSFGNGDDTPELTLRRADVSIEYLEYMGEYELISPEEARALLEQGYFFGGTQCPVCRMDNEPVDFSACDLVQIEYYGKLTEYVLPYYVFYRHLGQQRFDSEEEGLFPETDGLAEEYAAVYVPAVKVEGLEKYFSALAEEHAQNGHGAQ